MISVDWISNENHILLNPRMPLEAANQARGALEKAAPQLSEGHVFILTSGTTAQGSNSGKWVALSKSALLSSARDVNRHLQSDDKDRWFHCLPSFHVGGLSILARAFLSGASVIHPDPWEWNAGRFVEFIGKSGATLTSLVPTQVFDLVRGGFPSPSQLRAVLIGGGMLSPKLYLEARRLGWNLLPTYGMTEACSQIATAELESLKSLEYPRLRVLPSFKCHLTDQGQLSIHGTALLTGYIFFGPGNAVWTDPKKEGWFMTEDFCGFENGYLEFHGRLGDRIKIGGELSDLSRLRTILEEERVKFATSADMALIAAQDDRLEAAIHLLTESTLDESIDLIAKSFNQRVMPFERIRSIRKLGKIPRTELGKLKPSDLNILKET